MSSEVGQIVADTALGGAIGGAFKTAAAPVERVKLLLQTMHSNPEIASGRVLPYRGFWDCAQRVLREQGTVAFWRGNTVNVLRYAPQQGTALAVNDSLNRLFPRYDPHSEFWASFAVKLVSGGTAGGIAATVCYPFDFARTRLATDVVAGGRRYRGSWHCLSDTVRRRGMLAIYSGWSATIVGTMVYRAGQLGFFKQMQAMNPHRNDHGWRGVASAAVAGVVARSAITPFTYPFDTVRRRMMLDAGSTERLHKTTSACVRYVYRQRGVAGFYGGFAAEMVRGIGVGLGVAAYDRAKAHLGSTS
eukprot:CAMPEP_0174871236 /NCGR_PEP_ID=MMETSP1114-20130205/71133_1 /TAXON_ID=312471 /ORGANISM="Neobodo designis, Strain CCAP 1951/1" /LENGTH=302 /DNA_ID=CAMNT_0016106515 /DNA_START=48 /DNA_END=956 /DNA_ORIENTATION=+